MTSSVHFLCSLYVIMEKLLSIAGERQKGMDVRTQNGWRGLQLLTLLRSNDSKQSHGCPN